MVMRDPPNQSAAPRMRPDATGGGGGSVPVGTQVWMGVRTAASGTDQSSNHPPIHTQSTSTVQSWEEIRNWLLEAGVFVLSADRRECVARALDGAGITIPGLTKLRDFIFRGEKDNATAARYLGGILADPDRCLAAIQDLGVHERAKRQRAAERNMPLTPYRDAPQEGEKPEVWQHDRMCRIVWCRVGGDGRSVEEVADELGLKPGTVSAMLDRGRFLSGAPGDEKRKKKKHTAPEETHAKRLERFRRDMQERKRNASTN